MNTNWYHYLTVRNEIGVSSSNDAVSAGTKPYKRRESISNNDTEAKVVDDKKLRIECEDDKIKVITDDNTAQPGYAVPAECNVDFCSTRQQCSNEHG